MKEEDGTLKLGISDPSQTQDSVTIHVSGYENLQYVDGDQEVSVNVTADGADITVDTSAAAGESFELTLSYDAEKPETAVSTALLEYAIELAKDSDLTDVVPAVVEKFNAALANAEEIVEQVKAGDTSVTQEMVEDAKIGKIRSRANIFATSYNRTREKFAAALLAGGTGETVTVGGSVYDATCADGKPLFSKEHPSVTGGAPAQ